MGPMFDDLVNKSYLSEVYYNKATLFGLYRVFGEATPVNGYRTFVRGRGHGWVGSSGC